MACLVVHFYSAAVDADCGSVLADEPAVVVVVCVAAVVLVAVVALLDSE